MKGMTWSVTALAVAMGLAGLTAVTVAQDVAAPPTTQRAADPKAKSQRASGDTGASTANRDRRLPPDSVTTHKLEVPGRTLEFTATAGKLVMENAQGVADAEMAYIAFTLTGREARTRPITFAINGGPGSASAWLNVGGLGPWRLPMEKADISPSAVPELVANAETWLDFTDLVFIDPVGTGFSRLLQAPAAQQPSTTAPAAAATTPAAAGQRPTYYSVEGDIDSLATFIRRYLTQTNRLLSPKILVGESYAGFRAPKIAAKLQSSGGIGLSALVIVSPVLDFTWLGGTNHPLAYLDTLPSFAAAAREGKGQAVTRKDLADVEAYATGEFIADLMKGERDPAAVTRIVEKVTAFTGLEPALVRQRSGRIDAWTFMRESRRGKGEIVSIYDSSVGAIDPFPASVFSRPDDAFTGRLAAPVTSAMLDLYQTRLNWRPEGEYFIASRAVNAAWDYGRGGRTSHEAVSDLRRALALDPRLDVVIAHGTTDIITPYFRSKQIIDQMPVIGDPERLRLAVYPGGHMFYSRGPSREQFRRETAETIERIIKARQ